MVPEYINNWKREVIEVDKGFTMLTDATEMKIDPVAVREGHGQAQAMIISKGVKKIAKLQADKSSEIPLNGVSKETQMPKKNFTLKKETEKWLGDLFVA